MLGIFGKKNVRSGLVGVSYSNRELALAHVENSPDGPVLLHCESQPADSLKSASDKLGRLVNRRHLEGVRCNFVLCPEDYSLLLIEQPPVEDGELAQAAKWKIKDMVDRPLDQLAISVFRVPAEAYRGQRDMLYVVAAEKKRVQQAVDLITGSGLRLESIDIPELAMHNLLPALEVNPETGVALIDLRHDGSLLNLARNDAVFLTRNINTQIGEDIAQNQDWETVKERLVLEIQRSLDYYESQMGQGQITKLLLAPRKHDSQALLEQLNSAMGVKVELLDMSLLSPDEALPLEIQDACMMAIGGALRSTEAA